MAKRTCPLWRAPCKEHGCEWYMQLTGNHPQTGAQLSEWGCAIPFLVVTSIDTAKQARSGAAATESFRNEMVKANAVLGVMQQIESNGAGPLQLTTKTE